MIILDTNVISELVRREPSENVLRNVRKFPSQELYTTAIAEAEVRLGLVLLPPGKKRLALQSQVDLMFKKDFAGRILPFDSEAVQAYASLVAARRSAGRPISVFDAQIAAIVQSRGGVLVTRNTRDFEGCGFDVVNPWNEA